MVWGILSVGAAAQTDNRDPHEVREGINRRCMAIQAETPEVFAVDDRTIERSGRRTPLRLYTPANGDGFPLILLIHGGAWVAGNLDTHDNLARYLSKHAEAVVVSVGYENSPEGKFPGVLEQCYDALLWAVENAGAIHADAERLAVAGDLSLIHI